MMTMMVKMTKTRMIISTTRMLTLMTMADKDDDVLMNHFDLTCLAFSKHTFIILINYAHYLFALYSAYYAN